MLGSKVNIREANANDWDAIWEFFSKIVRFGDTYAFDTELDKQQGFALWMTAPRKTFVIEADGKVLGTYYLKTNHSGPGKHVCNCGYMVHPMARGKGLASLMCEHSQQIATELAYRAMQFNFVASSNIGAIRLWERHGYEIVGRLPGAFNHPSLGFIDALLMFKQLPSAIENSLTG